jgi:hypothetical protein
MPGQLATGPVHRYETVIKKEKVTRITNRNIQDLIWKKSLVFAPFSLDIASINYSS